LDGSPGFISLFLFCGGCIYNLGNEEIEKLNGFVAVQGSVARMFMSVMVLVTQKADTLYPMSG
jgi:hypothetical protein